MTVVTIVVSIACFIVGGFASYMFFKHGLKSKYDSILKEAETEAEVIKKNKGRPPRPDRSVHFPAAGFPPSAPVRTD